MLRLNSVILLAVFMIGGVLGSVSDSQQIILQGPQDNLETDENPTPTATPVTVLDEDLDLARLGDIPVVCQRMRKFRGFEPLLSDAALRVQLPDPVAHVKDIGIAGYNAGCLRRYLTDDKPGASGRHPV